MHWYCRGQGSNPGKPEFFQTFLQLHKLHLQQRGSPLHFKFNLGWNWSNEREVYKEMNTEYLEIKNLGLVVQRLVNIQV